MRPSALSLVACPSCGADLKQVGDPEPDAQGHVMEGTLACRECCATYLIAGGIPRLIPGVVQASATETASRFGKEWKIFDHMSDYQEEWFRKWIEPLGPDDFRGKTIFEGGCGKGRHTVTAASWGCKDIVALDLGEAVDVAFAYTRELPNVHVVQGDLLQPPVKRVFDVAFSVGVLHHLPDPRGGFDSLRGIVKPGGKVAIWVYGYESNEWIVRYVNPLREKVTSKIPEQLLYWLSLPPSAVLAAGTKAFRSQRIADAIPQGAYLARLATLPVKEVHHIVFDQLVTPLAVYLREDEVLAWFDAPELRDVQINWHNKNSWRGLATVTR